MQDEYLETFHSALEHIMTHGKQTTPKARAPWEYTTFSYHGWVARITDDMSEASILSAFPVSNDGTIFHACVQLDHDKLTVLSGSKADMPSFSEEL